MTARPFVVVLHGPSGVGKDSVVDRLRELGVKRPKSSTDRAPRPGETSDHYNFYTRGEFLDRASRGEFLEWATVYGDLKGLERTEFERALDGGGDIVIRTDVQGARAWRTTLEGAVFVMLVPESDEALRRRLIARGTDSPETVERRMDEWQLEKLDMPHNDYVVVNREEGLEQAVREVLDLIEKERANPARPSPRVREEVPPGVARA